MAQEIMVAGAIYEDVPSVRLPDSDGVFHPFTDTSDTTAVAADVAEGKLFHLADGSAVTGTAAGATLVTKSITANGTYDPSDDDADGYSEVTVDVSGGGGGSSNVAVGTFVAGESKAGNYEVLSIPYSGNGYPVSILIYVENGVDNPDAGYYNTNAKGAVGFLAARKMYKETEPTYSGYSTGNMYSVIAQYKRNATGVTYFYDGSGSINIASGYSPDKRAPYEIIEIGAANTLNYVVVPAGNSTIAYGLLEGVTYGYTVVYSE